MPGPPSLGEPTRPLFRDDPDHIRQVAATFTTALLHGEQPKPGCFPDGVLDHRSADPGAGRDFVHAPTTLPMLASLIPDDAHYRQFADRELAGQCRWHWT